METNGFTNIERLVFTKLDKKDQNIIIQSIINGNYDRRFLIDLYDKTMMLRRIINNES